MVTRTTEASAVSAFARAHRHPAVDVGLRVARNPAGAASGIVIIVLVLMAVFADYVTPYGRFEISLDVLKAPSFAHPFGTDDIGRDQFTRLVYGARISIYVGLLAVGAGVVTGAVIGLVSGFFGGILDLVVQRFIDAMLAFPGLVLAMALVAVLGPSTTNALLAITIVILPYTSRVIRSAVLSVKQNTYVEAATAVGASPARVMFRHILPNVTAPILILISSLLGAAILIEASLSFLGLGTQSPVPSWGLMLSQQGRNFMEIAPWLAFFPGIAISVTVLAFNLLGDVVRDVLDPRLRGSR